MLKKPDACKGCPLEHDGEGFAGPEGPANAQYLLIGEALGMWEAMKGRPFIGPTGQMLRKMLGQAGIDLSLCRITNAVKCRPPANRPPTVEERGYCRNAYLEEELMTTQAKVIIPVGQTALSTFSNIKGTITEARGYISETVYGPKLLPIVHPSFVAQGNPHFWDITVADLKKASRSHLWRPHHEEFIIFPTIEDIVRVTNNLLADKRPYSFDLETIGIEYDTLNIRCCGVAWSPNHACIFPLLKQGGDPYWSPHEESIVVSCLLKLFYSDSEKITQNGFAFDLAVLHHHKIEVAPPVHDTLVMHHVVATEMPHSLRFLTSIYTDMGFYKSDAKDAGGMLFGSDEGVHKYCLRDCIATFIVWQGLKKEMGELGLL